jgi:hypothetical protein
VGRDPGSTHGMIVKGMDSRLRGNDNVRLYHFPLAIIFDWSTLIFRDHTKNEV